MIKVTLIGRLGHDPRIGQLPSGDPVLNLSVAGDRYRKGEKVTYWWDVTMFGDRGVKLHDFLRKGSLVYVEGEYGEREYTDKQGQQRVQREILARDIQLLDRKPDEEAPRTTRPMPNQNGARPPAQQQPMYTRSFGGNHRDDFGPGGRAQQTFGGAAAQRQNDPPPFDDDIPF